MFVLLCVVVVIIILVSYQTACLMKKQRRIEKIMMKNFSGPELKFFFGSALDFLGNKGMLDVFGDYQSKFGDVVYTRVGPIGNALIITDSNFARAILQTRTNLNKGKAYTFTENWLGNGLLTAPAEIWEHKRKLLTPAFDIHLLMDFVDVFDKQCEILVEKLIDLTPVDSINMHSLISLCSLDIICETSMGVSIGAQQNQNSDYVAAVKEMCRIIAARSSSVVKSMKPLYVFTEDYRTEKKCVEILHRYTERVIEQKRIERQNRKPEVQKREMTRKRKISNLLEILLDYSDKEKSLSEEEIKDEVHTFMFAGHDTVTAAVSFFIYEIAKHVDVQNELYAEQQEIYRRRANKSVQYMDMAKMKLLDMAIKESLRLYPPVPVFSRKVTKEFKYDGKLIPEGVNLTHCTYGLHRNNKYYDEPDTFRFRRFENRYIAPPGAYLPFSIGARNCIGQKFASWEMKVMLSKLIRQFEFRPAEPEHILDLRAEVVLTSKNGINVKVIRRRK